MAALFSRFKPDEFFSLGAIEKNACSNPHKSIEELKKLLIELWDKIPQNTLRATVNDVPKRLNAVLNNIGEHFEN